MGGCSGPKNGYTHIQETRQASGHSSGHAQQGGSFACALEISD